MPTVASVAGSVVVAHGRLFLNLLEHVTIDGVRLLRFAVRRRLALALRLVATCSGLHSRNFTLFTLPRGRMIFEFIEYIMYKGVAVIKQGA